MKRFTWLRRTGVAAFIVVAGFLASAHPAYAADYDNQNMIDDGTFNDVNAMGSSVRSLSNPSAADFQQITAFLRGQDGRLSAPSPCLANYMTQNWYYDGTKFFFGGDADWNSSWGPAQISAAQLIYTTAHMWGINPQVLMATLQKEQSLISGTDCAAWRYNSAMGYGCPDSGGCNAKYVGFTKQVFWAGWQLMYSEQRAEGNLDWLGNGDLTYVGFFSNGTYQKLPYKRCNSCASLPNAYSTPATIDGQSIRIANGATAALYTYTPHLNQSFPSIFERWFGSVRFRGSDPVGSFDMVQQVPGGVRVAGWGLDRGITGTTPIHIYIDGIGAGVIWTVNPRPDVGAIFPGTGNMHGFDGTIPYVKPGEHQVCVWVVGDNLGAPNANIGCKTLNINADPVGSFDIARQESGVVRVAGWGLDRSLIGPATIHIYADGVGVGQLLAGNTRPDVGAIFPASGDKHGFDGILPYSISGSHSICAWVVGDTDGARNYGLGCKTILINNDPIGSLDVVQKLSNGVRVAGWGLDRSMTVPASVHVYIDGIWGGAISAPGTRPDIEAAFPGFGSNHGYDSIIEYSGATGSHRVCAWVVGGLKWR